MHSKLEGTRTIVDTIGCTRGVSYAYLHPKYKVETLVQAQNGVISIGVSRGAYQGVGLCLTHQLHSYEFFVLLVSNDFLYYVSESKLSYFLITLIPNLSP